LKVPDCRRLGRVAAPATALKKIMKRNLIFGSIRIV
jgi:hypothetical protein